MADESERERLSKVIAQHDGEFHDAHGWAEIGWQAAAAGIVRKLRERATYLASREAMHRSAELSSMAAEIAREHGLKEE